MKKQLSLVTLALIVTACSGGGLDPVAFGGRASVTASAATSTVDPTASGNTNVTFTSERGSLGVNVTSATLTVPGSTSAPVTVTLAAKTIPSGFVCAEATGLNIDASCSINDSGTTPGNRTVQYAFGNSELFSKAMTSFPGAKTFELRFGGNVSGSNAAWTSNALPFNVTAPTTTPGQPAAPQPTFAINNTETQPFSNILSVNVSANLNAGQEVQKLVLEVTDSRGLTDTESFTATSASATFSVDTTKYPDGNLTLKAVVLTKTGQSGVSAQQVVQIRNLVPPAFQIVKPTLNQIVPNILDAQVQLTQQNTGFTIAGTAGTGTATLNIRDYRGNVLLTKNATFRQTNTGLFVADAQFDMNGKLTPNNAYTLEAVTRIRLAGEATDRTITQVTQFQSQNSNLRPPSLLMHLPTFFGDAGTGTPILNRSSGGFFQVSDDEGVKQLQLQFACTNADPACVDSGSYSYNYPVDAKGVIPLFVNLGQVIDAQPFVKDGNYTLRATVTDTADNTSIQEVPVKVSRLAQDNVIGGLTTMRTLTYPDFRSKQFNPRSAVWYIGNPAVCAEPEEGKSVDTDTCVEQPTTSVNPTRVATLVYIKNTEQFGVSRPDRMSVNYYPAGSQLVDAIAFNEEGEYQVSFLVEDMVTGVVKHYSGGVVRVKKNEE